MKNLAWLFAALAAPATLACVIEPGTVGQPPAPEVTRVAPVRRYSVECGTRSPSGYGAGFHDARKGGECWACPNSNPIRTWAAVTAADACATQSFAGVGARVARAKYLGPHGKCPAGDVQKSGYCHYCPQGSAWDRNAGTCIQ